MKDQIQVIEGFCPVQTCAHILRDLFDRKHLWEDRSLTGKPAYRNGHWFTVGASVYMDLTSPESVPAFAQKTGYFNFILRAVFPEFYSMFLHNFQLTLPGSSVQYLNDVHDFSPLPGFHIFPPEETLQAPFGKIHTDIQWQALERLPEFPFPNGQKHHFTFTLPLVMPYQGGGMLIPAKEGAEMPTEFYFYEEGNLYIHSGQFPHQVLPLRAPVTPLDWRITFQGHGFTIDNKTYLYW